MLLSFLNVCRFAASPRLHISALSAIVDSAGLRLCIPHGAEDRAALRRALILAEDRGLDSLAHFSSGGKADVVVFAFRVFSLRHRHEGAVLAVTDLNAADGKTAAERNAGCRQQVFAALHGKDLDGHVHRAGVIFIQV